jgi:hypothetical protein
MREILSIDDLEILRWFVFALFIVSATAVTAGVYWEKEEFPPFIRHFGWNVLVWSLGAEIVLTIAVFVIDGTISIRQQSKIIALEIDAAPRSITKEQYETIMTLKGKVPAINVMAPPTGEPALFAMLIEQVFWRADIKYDIYFPPNGYQSGGNSLCLPKVDGGASIEAPLFKVFFAAKMVIAGCAIEYLPFVNLDKSKPLLVIGERIEFRWTSPPYLPEADAPKKKPKAKLYN